MDIIWHNKSWEEFDEWESINKKTHKRIKELIKDTLRNGNLTGIGNPEALKGDMSGLYSRHIDKYNRFIYCVTDKGLEIFSCKEHYKK